MGYHSIPADVGYGSRGGIKFDDFTRNDSEARYRRLIGRGVIGGFFAAFEQSLHPQTNAQIRSIGLQIGLERFFPSSLFEHVHGAVVGAHAGEDYDLCLGDLLGGGDVDDREAAGGEGVADGADVAGSVIEEGDG